MEKNDKSGLKIVNEPTEGLLEYYEKLYKRNQTKFIRRSSLESSHLGAEFQFEGKNLKLLGSVDDLLMLVKDETGNFYRMNCNTIAQIIVGKP